MTQHILMKVKLHGKAEVVTDEITGDDHGMLRLVDFHSGEVYIFTAPVVENIRTIVQTEDPTRIIKPNWQGA